MASQVPAKKNAAFSLGLCLYKTDNTLITNPGTITAKISKDFGDYADVGTKSEEDSTYGQIKLALTATEMNADVVMLYVVDDTSGCVPFTATIYTAANLLDDVKTDTAAILADTGTDGVVLAADAIASAKIADDAFASEHFATGAITADAIADDAIDAAAIADDLLARLGVVAYGTAQAAGATSIQLAAASDFDDDELNGAVVVITGGTGIGQSRVITDYTKTTPASDTATVDAWKTTPSGTITYVILAAPPASTTAPAGVDVLSIQGSNTAAANMQDMFDGTGYAGGVIPLNCNVSDMDANTITAAAIATGAIDADALAADAGTEIGTAVWATTTRQLTGTQTFNVTGDITGNLSGSVGSVTGAVGSVTAVSSGAITAASIATGAIDADAISADAVAEIADGVLDEAMSGHTSAGTLGKAVADVLDDTGTAGVIVASVAANAINAAAIATGAIDADSLATDAVNEIVDQVWNETLGDHVGAGSTGAGLTAAGAAGDPWSTSVPGAYGAGTAGYLIGTHINAPISTVDTVVDAIKVKTDYLPSATAGTAGGVFIAGSNAATSVTTALTANITGSLSGSVGSVTGSVGSIALKKNTALAKFAFVMRDSTNHAPASGLTVTATRSIDGGAFGAGSLSAVTEVGNGVYTVDFAAADLNGAVVVLKCTAAASDTVLLTIVTNP